MPRYNSNVVINGSVPVTRPNKSSKTKKLFQLYNVNLKTMYYFHINILSVQVHKDRDNKIHNQRNILYSLF